MQPLQFFLGTNTKNPAITWFNNHMIKTWVNTKNYTQMFLCNNSKLEIAKTSFKNWMFKPPITWQLKRNDMPRANETNLQTASYKPRVSPKDYCTTPFTCRARNNKKAREDNRSAVVWGAQNGHGEKRQENKNIVTSVSSKPQAIWEKCVTEARCILTGWMSLP